MNKDTLLIELGTEELPPKSLKKLAVTFHQHVKQQLETAELKYDDISWYATPRRLALLIKGLSEYQQDKIVEKRGPAINVAFDDNNQPSKAAQGWARSNGITVDQAERLKTDKGEWLLYKATVIGKSVKQLIPDMVNSAINKLPVPKPMRWGSSRTQFIRPVHTLTIMLGSEIIAGNVLGIDSSNTVTGHRFHHHGLVTISHADKYEEELKAAHVVVDYEIRKETIKAEIILAADALNGEALLDADLLEEVSALVEWPVVLVGSFDEDFLQVPAEPLIYSMKDHQKYFPVQNKQGKLINQFIFVSNIESKDPIQVIKGNEKVIRPRLADAEFFYKTDQKQTLESRLSSLENVLFQKQLGTLKEKSERIADLSKDIAGLISESESKAYRAGLLCKSDLMTDMVLEFPQVQGTMGKYYAQHDGEDSEVSQALEDQYRPRYAGDCLPVGNIGCCVAIADKIDSLVGIFGINQPPKGDKDPFALRRAAIGLIRIIIEKKLTIDLAQLINRSVVLYGEKLSNDNVVAEVLDFILGRFKAFYQEQGISSDIIQSVLIKAPTAPLDFEQRIKAVSHFSGLVEASALAAANKRVGNILAKFNGQLFDEFDEGLVTDAAEQDLASTLVRVKQIVSPLMLDKNYQQALTELAQLKTPIDTYFDNVMVMVDDEKIKTNRLTLLNEIRNIFLEIADISVL